MTGVIYAAAAPLFCRLGDTRNVVVVNVPGCETGVGSDARAGLRACAIENPDGHRFCGSCGAALDGAGASSGASS